MTADKKRKSKGSPDSVDVHVGQRLRVRRSLLGLSQEKLAEAVGLTFQQVQKYERGLNRISAGRLYQFSKILDIPVSYFYEQLGTNTSQAGPGLADNDQEGFISGDLLENKETLDLIRVYYSIEDKETRKDIMRFIKSMASKVGSSN